ncbi:TetR/AcrR family transcriptional regulator [Bradyrhizobium japonicum]|uniref:TetR/AcrR family transcriptional regulator n=2 Tax=Bradyrhizobium japonicum TaxID=375 RepID=UPI000456CB03|nr:TetR/AcrR family transcriptional regulator [Bradyrhizobium japonicum]AHY55556.1 transcriptional regulator, TetR family [Bradyrhizobium japonicum SEMIA 5079]MEB2670444.1 TetR/AcrR family transcriptional regulator [Bradyrhizobium japonicum]WRI71768.1 TetR/AcrR family transcriptional regulator [Bradyrhizobium japonicum]WRI80590.1 TetR/AcrR family transcriptional regulator [Bradyrhizobium japonicum]WRI89792.1 TetR/AcrR family transcriptional regulator [Bradyrhizobium japonicum]
MTTTAPKPRSKTVEQILDLAETMIQTRGYSAFSYQDIADGLGIRKASIHYYFPSKADLGAAVIDRYVARFDEALAAIGEDPQKSSLAVLDFYVEPYVGFAKTSDRICLCGALAGEILALPPPLRSRVDGFFQTHQDWLTRILKRGASRGEFVLAAPPAKVARFIFSALQGALLVKRATGDASQLRDVITVMKLQLAAGS